MAEEEQMTVKGEEEFRRTGRRKRELGLEERELLKEKRLEEERI